MDMHLLITAAIAFLLMVIFALRSAGRKHIIDRKEGQIQLLKDLLKEKG